MKKIIYSISLMAIVAAIFSISSCTKKPEPDPVVEQEEFDAANISFIHLNTDGSQTTDTTIIAFAKDGTPSPSHAHLHPDTKYRVLINLFYKGNVINQEIADEGTEHQFFFIPTVAAGIANYEYKDFDQNGKGIGLDGTMTLGSGEFELRIVLSHGLDKNSTHAQSWNSTTFQQAGGSTDLDVSFEMHAE